MTRDTSPRSERQRTADKFAAQTGSVANNQFLYEIQNFQSHLSGICDDKQHIDWVMRRM